MPGRAASLADASFFGKFDRLEAEYDALPTLDEPLDEAGDEPPAAAFSDESMFFAAQEKPREDLASLAERTRSQLMSRKPALSSQIVSAQDALTSELQRHQQPGAASSSRIAPSSSRVTGAPSSSCVTFAETPEPSAIGKPAAKPKPATMQKPLASMMTHPASRCTSGKTGSNPSTRGGAGHTFGSLPRASPSGTMPHHVPKALPSAAAEVAVRRPRSARSGASAATRAAAGDGDGGSTTSSRPSSARSQRAGSAETCEPCDVSDAQPKPAAAEKELPAFGAAAKGGALAWRPASASTRSRRSASTMVALKDKEEAAKQKAARVVMCCGDEFDGFCCKRHHPDDSIVCCARHAPPSRRSALECVALQANKCPPCRVK